MRETTQQGAAPGAVPAARMENTRRLARARVVVADGRALSHEALREMSDFRRSIMRMKPEVDLDADFVRFAGFVARCPAVVRVRDAEGVLRGTFALRWIDERRGARSWRLILPEYAFFHPTLRGSGAFPYAVLRVMASRPELLFGDEVFLGGVGYPTGVLASDSIFGPTHFLSDPHLDASTREALERIVAEIAGPRFDAATGRVFMPTLPPRPGPRWFQRMAPRDAYQRYVARCPDWSDGYALPCVFRVSVANVARALAGTMLRSARTRWSSEP